MGLFGNKIEKALQKIKKKEFPLIVRYADGNQTHPSNMMRVDRDKFLIKGFTEQLREDLMDITVKELGITFVTKVTHITHDVRGTPLYYCTYPDKLNPLTKRPDRYFVYPKGVAALSETSLEDLIVEREDVKMMKAYIWVITREGLELVNSKGYKFEQGHKFPTCKISLGKVEATCALELQGEDSKSYGKQALPILRLKFNGQVENMEDLIKIACRVDCM